MEGGSRRKKKKGRVMTVAIEDWTGMLLSLGVEDDGPAGKTAAAAGRDK